MHFENCGVAIIDFLYVIFETQSKKILNKHAFILQCSNLLDEGGYDEFFEELREEYDDIRQDHYDNVAEKVRSVVNPTELYFLHFQIFIVRLERL